MSTKAKKLDRCFDQIGNINFLSDEIENKTHTIREAEAVLVEHYQELKRLRAAAKVAHKVPQAKKVINGILDIERVKNVQIADNSFVITTKTIYIRHQKCKYKIGCFKIVLTIDNPTITITNTTRARDEYHHPHVSARGHICWGEIATGITKLYSDMMYVELVTVIIHFLQSYNHLDSYVPVGAWRR